MSDVNKHLKYEQHDPQRSKSGTSANQFEGEVKRTLQRSTSQHSVKEGTSIKCQRPTYGCKETVSSDRPRRRRPNSKQRKEQLRHQREFSGEGADGLEGIFARMGLGARSSDQNTPSPEIFRQRSMADRRRLRLAKKEESLRQRRIGPVLQNIHESSTRNTINDLGGRFDKLGCQRQYNMDTLTEDFHKLTITDGKIQQQATISISRKRTQSPVFYTGGPSDPKRSRL